MKNILNAEEHEVALGESIKALRLQRNLTRDTLCERAGVSLHALKNLEGGKGSSLKTLVLVIRTLGREDWFETLAPRISVNPLTVPRMATTRLRASKRIPRE